MLHQDTRSLELLKPQIQVSLLSCGKQYIKKVVHLNTASCFNVIMRLSLNIMCEKTQY